MAKGLANLQTPPYSNACLGIPSRNSKQDLPIVVIMRIAIVGGGFSGSAVAINILRRSVDEILLTLLEKGDTIGVAMMMTISAISYVQSIARFEYRVCRRFGQQASPRCACVPY